MATMATMGKARRVLGPVISAILLDDAPREAELDRGRLRKVPSTLTNPCRDPCNPPRSRRVVNRALMAAMGHESKNSLSTPLPPCGGRGFRQQSGRGSLGRAGGWIVPQRRGP